MDELIKQIETLDADMAEIDSDQEAIESKADKENGGKLTDEQREEYDALSAKYEEKKAERDKLFADFQRKKARSERQKMTAPQRKTQPDSSQNVNISNAKSAAEDDPKKGFKTHREFFTVVMDAGLTGRVDERLHLCVPDRQAAVGSDEAGTYSDPHGGFLIPKGFSPNLMSVMAESDPLAGRTTQIPMETATVDIPARVDKDHSNSVSGGLRVHRRAETQAVDSSRMEFEQITLRANSLFGVAHATEEILSRSPSSFVALLESGFRDEFGAKLVDERLNGSGVGMMEGVMNTPALVSVAKETSQAADTIEGANVLKMRSRCWGYGSAIWLANHDTLVQLVSVHIAGTNGDIFLFHPGNGTDKPDTLLGRPIIFTEYVKTLGDKGDILLGNWSQYLEGTLEGMDQAESVHVRFLNHERTFKFWMENDGRSWWRESLTPKNSTVKRSPFVTLDERA